MEKCSIMLAIVIPKHISSQCLFGIPYRKPGFISMVLLGVRCRPSSFPFICRWAYTELGSFFRGVGQKYVSFFFFIMLFFEG